MHTNSTDRPRIGELFAGYGGLGMAVQAVYGGEVAWYSEFDAAPSAIMAHHHPGVPNHGDVTTIDWSTVEPVDILTGGFPCQDVSVAGRRAGMTDGTRSGLWSHMAHAIDVLRPQLVIIENVGGLFSAKATSFMEPHPMCLGSGGTGIDTVSVRAIDAVLSTLSELGYDAEWTAVRASDVGAPHQRLRVFITAHPSGSGGGGGSPEPGQAPVHSAPVGPGPGGHRGRPDGRLMPTPVASEALGQMPGALLPTPRATDGTNGGPNQRGSSGDLMLPSAVQAERFGPYAPAIARWERVVGHPAPDPTEPGRNRPRLAARFVEWMMGLPEGHVTDAPGLSRNQHLKALGNGVVPQQGAAALLYLHHVRSIA